MRIPADDPTHPDLAVFMGLRDHAARQAREAPGGDMAGSFMAEGSVVIQRVLRAGLPVASVLVDAVRPNLDVALPSDVPIHHASPEVLRVVCGRPRLRDPIACVVRPEPRTVEEVLQGAATVAVLEGVVNPTNMGVIMRCAAGLGVDAVVVDPTSCDPLYRRAVRVSMGEVLAVPHARCQHLPDGLAPLRAGGFTLAALTPDPRAADIGDVQRVAGDRFAVLLGSEGPGLSAATLAAADARVRIPMAAGVDSINVGSAAAVAFHALRPRR